MENKKSMSPILIVILTIIGVCLVALGTWFVINYVRGKDEPVVPSDNSNDIKELTNFEEVYNNLRTTQGGFYFSSSVNISDISANEFFEYALAMYVKENNIVLYDNLDCVTNNGEKYGDCSNTKVSSASKSLVDNYIREKFNTTRTFSVTSGKLTDWSGSDLGDYYYKESEKTYYFGQGSSRGYDGSKIFTKLTDAKEDETNIYFYDKVVYCSWGPGNTCWSSTDQEFYTSAIFEFNEIASGKKYNEIKSFSNDILILNEDYVFDKYADKLNTYKHTYKKDNGKYYWVSSEIIK